MMMVAVRTMRARVAHQAPDRPALQLAVGDRVEVGERDTEWPEFVFVTATHGTGWVPARYLSATSGSAVIQSEYDTTELSTRTGEVLEVLAEDVISGWHWCRARDGSEGWIPIKTLEAIKSPMRDRRP